MTKISQLSDIGGSLAAGDEFVIRDVSDISTPNKKVTASGFIDYVISQGTGAGFTQIAAGVGPLARALATSSGATGTLTFSTAAATTLIERARIDSAGRFLVGTSTANTSGAKLQTSDGLTFPATAVASTNPNTLDDYEEGTWTPGQGTGVTVVGTFSSTGSYTKIGRIVNYEGAILSTTSVAYNSAGVTSIATGLPFSVAPGGINGSATNNTATAFSLVIAAGTAVLGASSIAATTAIYFSGQYMV